MADTFLAAIVSPAFAQDLTWDDPPDHDQLVDQTRELLVSDVTVVHWEPV